MKSTISVHDVIAVYEDPDALQPADVYQSEVQSRPVPRPRSKLQLKAKFSTGDNAADSADKVNNTSTTVDSHIYEQPTDYIRPHPIRPPPKPPVSSTVTSDTPTAVVSSQDPNPPAVRADRAHCPVPPWPKRPPLSSTYCSRPSSTAWLTSEAADPEDKPAVPPRPGQSSLSGSASVYETSPVQTRPTPPRPSRRPSQSVHDEGEYRPYLHILPATDEDMMIQGRPPLYGQHYPAESSRKDTTANTEETIVMLRWLKKASKSDSLAPSLYGLSLGEEIRCFNQRAIDLRKALRLYNLLMMKRNESLRDLITEFRSISHSLNKLHKKNQTMDIAGGMTGAAGGVTAILGIALAPFTMGASLIATAVGAGMVASAGGMGAHTAKQATKKNVNRMSVEKLVNDYKANIVDLEHCLDFILSVMNELRRHDIPKLQRAGARFDALKMANLSQSVMNKYMNSDRKGSVAQKSGMSSERLLQAFAKEMDQYFTKGDGQKLKKSTKRSFSGRIRLLAENLQDELDHLNCMWEMFS